MKGILPYQKRIDLTTWKERGDPRNAPLTGDYVVLVNKPTIPNTKLHPHLTSSLHQGSREESIRESKVSEGSRKSDTASVINNEPGLGAVNGQHLYDNIMEDPPPRKPRLLASNYQVIKNPWKKPNKSHKRGKEHTRLDNKVFHETKDKIKLSRGLRMYNYESWLDETTSSDYYRAISKEGKGYDHEVATTLNGSNGEWTNKDDVKKTGNINHNKVSIAKRTAKQSSNTKHNNKVSSSQNEAQTKEVNVSPNDQRQFKQRKDEINKSVSTKQEHQAKGQGHWVNGIKIDTSLLITDYKPSGGSELVKFEAVRHNHTFTVKFNDMTTMGCKCQSADHNHILPSDVKHISKAHKAYLERLTKRNAKSEDGQNRPKDLKKVITPPKEQVNTVNFTGFTCKAKACISPHFHFMHEQNSFDISVPLCVIISYAPAPIVDAGLIAVANDDEDEVVDDGYRFDPGVMKTDTYNAGYEGAPSNEGVLGGAIPRIHKPLDGPAVKAFMENMGFVEKGLATSALSMPKAYDDKRFSSGHVISFLNGNKEVKSTPSPSVLFSPDNLPQFGTNPVPTAPPLVPDREDKDDLESQSSEDASDVTFGPFEGDYDFTKPWGSVYHDIEVDESDHESRELEDKDGSESDAISDITDDDEETDEVSEKTLTTSVVNPLHAQLVLAPLVPDPPVPFVPGVSVGPVGKDFAGDSRLREYLVPVQGSYFKSLPNTVYQMIRKGVRWMEYDTAYRNTIDLLSPVVSNQFYMFSDARTATTSKLSQAIGSNRHATMKASPLLLGMFLAKMKIYGIAPALVHNVVCGIINTAKDTIVKVIHGSRIIGRSPAEDITLDLNIKALVAYGLTESDVTPYGIRDGGIMIEMDWLNTQLVRDLTTYVALVTCVYQLGCMNLSELTGAYKVSRTLN